MFLIQGEEFVEIEEAWNEETHATHSVNENDLIDAGIRERHIDSTKDRQSVDDDDDDIDPVEEDEDNGEEIEFELLMQDMETVKLGEEDTSSAGVKQQQLKKIAPTGLRKGFLLQPPSAKESTTNAPSILVKSSNQDKSVPLKGTVVERMTETSTVPEQGSQSSGETKDEDTETLRKTQKHVSRFKQNRMLSRGPL